MKSRGRTGPSSTTFVGELGRPPVGGSKWSAAEQAITRDEKESLLAPPRGGASNFILAIRSCTRRACAIVLRLRLSRRDRDWGRRGRMFLAVDWSAIPIASAAARCLAQEDALSRVESTPDESARALEICLKLVVVEIRLATTPHGLETRRV